MTSHSYIQYSLILKCVYITAVDKENSDMELTVLWAVRRVCDQKHVLYSNFNKLIY